MTPPQLRQRWWSAAREERLVRWLKRGLVVGLLVGAALLAANWWLVQAFLGGREEALAAACRDSPFVPGSVTAAGGPEAITVPDDDALAPYRGDPEGRDTAALRIRDHASLVHDEDLASAAVAVTAGGPFETRRQIARVEAGCRRYLEVDDRPAASPRSFPRRPLTAATLDR